MGGMAQLSLSAFDATVDALLPEWPALPSAHRAAVSAHCAGFVRRQIALSPAHIRFGIRALFIVFCIFSRISLGMRRLGSVPRERRVAALKTFALEQVPPFVALERVLRSMTAVAFLEHPDVLTAIGDEPLPRAAKPQPDGRSRCYRAIAIEGPTTLTCDVLVIGTGAGGASAAATLADAGVDVLMLEEGPHIPAGRRSPEASRKHFRRSGAAAG